MRGGDEAAGISVLVDSTADSLKWRIDTERFTADVAHELRSP
ncbi:hypothetical protein [Streptomyces sp. NPDC090093]